MKWGSSLHHFLLCNVIKVIGVKCDSFSCCSLPEIPADTASTNPLLKPVSASELPDLGSVTERQAYNGLGKALIFFESQVLDFEKKCEGQRGRQAGRQSQTVLVSIRVGFFLNRPSLVGLACLSPTHFGHILGGKIWTSGKWPLFPLSGFFFGSKPNRFQNTSQMLRFYLLLTCCTSLKRTYLKERVNVKKASKATGRE